MLIVCGTCACLQAASITELLSHAASYMQQAGNAAVALQAQLSIPFCRAVKVCAMRRINTADIAAVSL